MQDRKCIINLVILLLFNKDTCIIYIKMGYFGLQIASDSISKRTCDELYSVYSCSALYLIATVCL